MTLNRIYYPLVVALAALAFYQPYAIQLFDNRIYDLFIQSTAPNKADPRIAIVGIDQKSLDTFGRWPWPRDVIGRLVEKLAAFGVTVTALDVSFSTETEKNVIGLVKELGAVIEKEGLEQSHPELFATYLGVSQQLSGDPLFADSIRRAQNVVTAFLFHSAASQSRQPGETKRVVETSATRELAAQKRKLIRPARMKIVQRDAESATTRLTGFGAGEVEPNIPLIQEAGAASGYLNVRPDSDGVIRSMSVFVESEGDIYPSLSLAAVSLYKNLGDDVIPLFENGLFSGAWLGDRFFSTDEQGFIYLRYQGADETFPYISAADVMGKSIDDTAFRSQLENKIIFVGATATQLYDMRVTPFGYTAGVEIHANAAANILTNRVIQKYGWQRLYDAFLTLVIGLLLLVILRHSGIWAGLFMATALLAALIGFNYWVFAKQLIWLNTVTPAMTIVIGMITITTAQFMAERQSKKFITGAFGRYLSPKVIDQIIENPAQLTLGGDKRIMTAFFSDVAGFTTISERLTPPALVALLNEYLSDMTDIIHELDGTVDKFEGDAIIAFWGAPIKIEDHAERCVRAAVRQQRRLAQLRKLWRDEGRDELFVRMGINTGMMVVGNMGSRDRMDYTMMGDAVNLAARLEGANKYYGSEVLVSEYTYGFVQEQFLCRRLDTVRVQGKKEPIDLYEVVEEHEATTEENRRFTSAFERALAAFHRMDFALATPLFERAGKLRPSGDTACRLYLKRCAELIAAPPPDDWDKVYDLAK